MTDESTDSGPRLDIDWVRTIAGALAAVSSAVLLSTLGAAGTIIGAAIGSIVATVGGALYAQGLAKSRQTLAQAQAVARDKVGIAQAEVLRAGRAEDAQAQESHLGHADERLAEAHEELDVLADEAAPTPWKERFAALPWKHIALVAAGLFLIAVLVITVFELIAGRSVSSITGGTDKDDGTTIGHVRSRDSGDGNDDEKQPDEQEPSRSPTPSQSVDPSEEPSETPSPTESVEPSPTESETPTETTTSTPADPEAS